MHKRVRDARKISEWDNQCRLCGVNTEYINNIISSCTKILSPNYLRMRHEVVDKTLYDEICPKVNPKAKGIGTQNMVEAITTHNMN